MDVTELQRFLERQLPAKQVLVSGMSPLGAGYSRVMSKLEAVVDGESRAFVTRGDPPLGMALIESDRDVEWGVLSTLTAAGGAPIAPARCYDADGTVFGCKTIVSDFVGSSPLIAILRQEDAGGLAALSERLADAAAAIHRSDTRPLGRFLEMPSDWDAYVDSRIELWRRMEREHVEKDPFIRRLAAWLDTHRPPPAPLTLLHGDFHAGNVLVQPDGGFIVVDWEFPRIGDPREDLGWFSLLGAMMPPDLISLTMDEFLARYRERMGLSEEVVNAESVAYFQMLAGANMFGATMQQAGALVREEVSNVALLYVTGAIVQGHQMWLHGPTALERSPS
jgi:aminoglycoside phosphotransferase (APT) family kinase protein